MKYLYLFITLAIYPFIANSQKLACRTDSILDMSNRIEYILKNDTTAIIDVTINNNSIQKEYYYLKDSESCNFIPKFVLKLKNSFVFLSGTHQHYRLLSLFQLEANNKIIVNTFENELMPESSNDKFEKIFFLYKDQPAIVFIDNNNKAYIRLYKKHYRINRRDIKYITIDSKGAIVSLKNNKRKVMAFSDFKITVGYK